ncbi:MAG: hypothetical protein ACP5D0_07545 [Hydrogenovibrio sp.]
MRRAFYLVFSVTGLLGWVSPGLADSDPFVPLQALQTERIPKAYDIMPLDAMNAVSAFHADKAPEIYPQDDGTDYTPEPTESEQLKQDAEALLQNLPPETDTSADEAPSPQQQWQAMQAQLNQVIQKERQLDELLHYFNSLKRIRQNPAQTPPPSLSQTQTVTRRCFPGHYQFPPCPVSAETAIELETQSNKPPQSPSDAKTQTGG